MAEQDPDSVSLREHIMSLLSEMDRRFEAAIAAQDKAVQIAMVASEKAVVKAEIAAEKRFEAVNEFRGQLADQAGTFMPRVEAEQRLQALSEKIEDVKSTASTSRDRGLGLSTGWTYLVAAAGIVIAIIAFATR